MKTGENNWCTIDTIQMGREYAQKGRPSSDFEKLNDYCKNSLSALNSDGFYSSYAESKSAVCKLPSSAFRMSYEAYRDLREPYVCTGEESPLENYEIVKTDGSSAYKIKKDLAEIEKQLKNELESERENKHYGVDMFFESIRRLFFRPNLEKLEQTHQEKVKELKAITKKYSLYISDLEDVRIQ